MWTNAKVIAATAWIQRRLFAPVDVLRRLDIHDFVRAGLASRVDVRVGPALETLPRLEAERGAAFDFTFIDADKVSTAQYLEWAIRLSRVGSVIVIDNVVRNGAVLLSASEDASVQGVRRAIDMLSSDERVESTAIQTVGNKGYDGFALAVVVSTEAGG